MTKSSTKTNAYPVENRFIKGPIRRSVLYMSDASRKDVKFFNRLLIKEDELVARTTMRHWQLYVFETR